MNLTASVSPAVTGQIQNALAFIHSSASSASASPDAAKLNKAAGEFEAILLQSLWKSMKETFKDPDDESFDPSLESFDDWGMQSLASAVGNSGGLGIKNMVLKYLEPQLGGSAHAASSAR